MHLLRHLVGYYVVNLSTFICLVYSGLSFSQTKTHSIPTESQTLTQLNELVKTKEYQQAYDFANQWVMDFGGEARFDYLMGLAAMKIKAYQDAIFAFERAVIAKPDWQKARFQIAKAYYFVENLAAARVELIKIQQDAKKPELVVLIAKFIIQIDDAVLNKKSQFKHVMAFSTGYDSNLNSGTQADSVFLDQLGTDIPLSDESREIEDTPFNLSYQGQYQHPINQNSLFIAQLGLYRIDFADSSEFECSLADVSLKYQDVLGDVTYQLGVFYRPMILDGEHYCDQYGIQSS